MPANRILLGVIGRAHGVRGLVHVTSHTADPASLTAYGPLSDDKGRRFALRWHGEGVAEVAELVDEKPVRITDRTAAEKLVNTRLYIDRAQLPEPDEDEFYLADLIGMAALGPDGAELGRVEAVHDYGAGTSLEIARPAAAPLLVPFTKAWVPVVDLAARTVHLTREAGEVKARSPEGEGPTAPKHRASRPSPGSLRAPASPAGGRGVQP